jgi:protein SCO1/2
MDHSIMKARLVFLLLLPFATTAVFAEKKPPAKKEFTCEVGLPPGKYSEKSVYRLGSTWTSDAGKEVKIDSLRGRPVVMALFFTNCEHSCPFIVKDMKSMQSALTVQAMEKVDFALVSIDPERDSPEALKAFRAKHKLPDEHWTLLRGTPEAVKRLAERLGFNYAAGSKTQFAHSLMVTVLNSSGEVAHQQVGIGVDRRSAVAALEKLAATGSKR